jgi:hypothetical protein
MPSVLSAYRAEVTAAKRWWRQHTANCPQCARAERQRQAGNFCQYGVMIRKYERMNQEIVDKMSKPDPNLVQEALFDA